MKTKIKTKTIASLIGLSFLMLIISALPVKAMANPASEYCVGVGGTLEIRAQEDGGQYGVCIFSDASECEEWALYNGDCQKGLINDEIKNENVKKQIVNIEKIQKIYNKLNKLSEQGLNENINEAKKMAEFDQEVSVNDLGIKKSGNLLNQISTFILSKKESGIEQIGTLPDSKLYPLKEMSRKVKMAFTFNPIKKVELQQRFANEKLMEAKKVYEKNKNPEQAEKLLEKYGEEAELISKRIEKIEKSPKNQAGIDNLLDNLTDHLLKREKVVWELKEKLEKQLPSQAYKKVEANLDRTVKKLGVKMERLEQNRESSKERFVKIAERQEGSEFKNFKNLEILKGIEEQMPSETSEAIKEARETIKEKFVQDISRTDTETRMNFQNYLDKSEGNSIRHLEIVQEIASEEIPPEVRVEIEKAKEKAVGKIEKEMKKMKSKQQRENFLEVLKDPEIEKLRVIKELEDKLPSEFLSEIKKVKEKNIHSIQKKIKNNSTEQKEFIEKAKQFHDASQFEILEEIGMNVNGKIKQVIDKAMDKTYEEFENDIKRVEGAKNKRMILEKLTTDQPNHIEVLNRVQKKMEIRQLEGKFSSQSAAPDVFNRVIDMQTEKINSRIENMDDKIEVEKIQEQIQNNDEIRKEMMKRILNFERKIKERKNFIRERSSTFEKIPSGGTSKCAKEGEMPGRNGCCEGLTAKEAAKVNLAGECYYMRHLICLSCGDGKCDFNENKCNCPEDCKENLECGKEGERVNRNPLMGSTDKQCCPGLVENRVSRSYSICEKTGEKCIKEGEKHLVGQKCCSGLKSIKIYSDNSCSSYVKSAWYCTKCGDGICKSPENKCNCPEDCKKEIGYNLDEYYSNIDYSCNTDSDCVIKDVHNCCGYYPKCVDKNAKTDSDYVRKACAVKKIGSVCGFPSIDSCRCVQNKCEGFLK